MAGKTSRKPAPSAPPSRRPEIVLIEGEDEFGVKQRAREIFQQWSAEAGGFDHEIIEGAAANAGEVFEAIRHLREALQTLPFFGPRKVIWLQNCTFLGDDRTSSSEAVKETLAELAGELSAFSADNVSLLISAGKADRRKTFFKTIEKIGKVESFAGWSTENRDWINEAAVWAERKLRAWQKTISEEALAKLIAAAGPHPRHLANELEKLALYVGDRLQIEAADVEQAASPLKHSQAFALGDAVGNRDLPRALQALDQELWALKSPGGRSEVGLLYGLISKIRSLLLLKEMVQAGWLDANANYAGVKAQLERLPREQLPADRRFNPLASHPFAIFNGLRQIRHYTQDELVQAMAHLLECNRRLVSSNLDDALVLQQTLVQIVGRN